MSDRLVWSDAPTLRATGLEPETDYTLVTERRSIWGDATERSELAYRSDADGVIDTARSGPLGGGSASPYAPIRSMAYLRDVELDDLDAHRLRFRLLDGEGAEVLVRTVGIGPDRSALVEAPLGDDFTGAYV
ncbi:MAG: hypothetical protein WBG08_09655, partial [Litorimonas sp.]